MIKLQRYWIEFNADLDLQSEFRMIGVTAYGLDDALALIRERLFDKDQIPTIIKCIEDVDIQTLDQNHVIPNMGPPNLRGIWYPFFGMS